MSFYDSDALRCCNKNWNKNDKNDQVIKKKAINSKNENSEQCTSLLSFATGLSASFYYLSTETK